MEKFEFKPSSIDKVVGGTKWEQKEEAGYYKSRFEDASEIEGERGKTPEELAVLKQVAKFLPDFVQKYGGKAMRFKPEQFHIRKEKTITFFGKEVSVEKKWDSATQRARMEMGHWDPHNQRIEVVDRENLLQNTLLMIHEAIHALSFHSNELRDGVGEKRRSGLGIHNNEEGTDYFKDLNEAVTEGLVRRFDRTYFSKIPELAGALKKRDALREKVKSYGLKVVDGVELDGESLANEIAAADDEGNPIFYAYMRERRKMTYVMAEMLKADGKKFKDPVEVFDMFGKAALSGRLLDLARTIKKARGKGSFRKLGEGF